MKHKVKRRTKLLGSYLSHIARHYHDVRCRTVAASLSYTSLLALVPFMAIVFAVLAAVPALEGFRIELQEFVFANLMPESGDTFAAYFDGFLANAGKMTNFGIIGLAVTAIMLINTIFAAMNLIFHVEKPRPIVLRMVVYTGVLIVGPLVLAASFSLATYILTLTKAMGVEAFTGFLGRLTRFVPALILIFGFALFYKVVPNRKVAWRDALGGGMVAGLTFAGLRWLFGIYLIYFPTYQTIYGALSAVPVFLLWLFMSWSVVLAGAVVAASGPSWRERAH
ncbi:MAG: YihY family inner membrane protein [Rhodospirillaceae bacterium]|nr:YihY family inner membrane protein [Rhodospirillaceae bacterium]